jgi:hypothetical protein
MPRHEDLAIARRSSRVVEGDSLSEGLGDAKQCRKARVAIFAKRAIESFPRHAGVLGDFRHATRPGDRSERNGDIARIAAGRRVGEQFFLRLGRVEIVGRIIIRPPTPSYLTSDSAVDEVTLTNGKRSQQWGQNSTDLNQASSTLV